MAHHSAFPLSDNASILDGPSQVPIEELRGLGVALTYLHCLEGLNPSQFPELSPKHSPWPELKGLYDRFKDLWVNLEAQTTILGEADVNELFQQCASADGLYENALHVGEEALSGKFPNNFIKTFALEALMRTVTSHCVARGIKVPSGRENWGGLITEKSLATGRSAEDQSAVFTLLCRSIWSTHNPTFYDGIRETPNQSYQQSAPPEPFRDAVSNQFLNNQGLSTPLLSTPDVVPLNRGSYHSALETTGTSALSPTSPGTPSITNFNMAADSNSFDQLPQNSQQPEVPAFHSQVRDDYSGLFNDDFEMQLPGFEMFFDSHQVSSGAPDSPEVACVAPSNFNTNIESEVQPQDNQPSMDTHSQPSTPLRVSPGTADLTPLVKFLQHHSVFLKDMSVSRPKDMQRRPKAHGRLINELIKPLEKSRRKEWDSRCAAIVSLAEYYIRCDCFLENASDAKQFMLGVAKKIFVPDDHRTLTAFDSKLNLDLKTRRVNSTVKRWYCNACGKFYKDRKSNVLRHWTKLHKEAPGPDIRMAYASLGT